MDYSRYLAEISTYKRVGELNDLERSALFKIMNTYQPSFYLRLRRHREPFNKDEQDAVTRLRESNLVEEVQSKKKSFLGREIVYALTTSGLFHIFSKPLSYPPQLLIRYQDNIILSALLFPYFEVDTIERSTARFYFMITQYLQECCRTTLNRIDAIKRSTSNPPEMDPSNQKRQVELLELDLRLHAKVIAFKLGVAHSESTILAMANSDGAATDSSRVALYDLESSMKTVLSKDRKFMQLLKEVQKDFENGYKELVELK